MLFDILQAENIKFLSANDSVSTDDAPRRSKRTPEQSKAREEGGEGEKDREKERQKYRKR